MYVLEMKRDLCESFLIDRHHVGTEALADGPDFKAYFPCGNGSSNTLEQPMTRERA